jgi:hypothetical protein
VSIDWNRLKVDIINAAVYAVNGTLISGEEKALRDVPVRKVFRSGRQTVRFKTATEIERDRPLRARLGLAPEILATPEAVAQVQASGRNPRRSTRVLGGRPISGGRLYNEYGFARTIEFPARGNRRNKAGKTRAERGLTEIRRDRANDFMPYGEDSRVLDPRNEQRLADSGAERYLSSRGKYELHAGRAVSQRRAAVAADVNARTGEVKQVHYRSVGPARLGGGLRSTIRIIRASARTFPVIEGWLVAGDAEHDYAIHQELGNRHNPAHPFLRPRLAEWKEELPAQLRRSFARTGR